ncbi:MAG: response regulator [Chloroflexi bacterium]|nr:response regulator [Chloroflexota bacterium]
MEQRAFSEQVRDALIRFHDRAYLQAHPLARLLLSGPLDGQEGARLQRLLLDTIEEMKPQIGGQIAQPEWRRYRCLFLRYVEGLTHEQATQRLNISHRQGHRDHHEAVERLSSLLWQRRQAQSSARGGDAVASGQKVMGEATGSPLEVELRKLEQAAGHGPANLAMVLSAALGTVADLAAVRQVQVQVSLEPDLPPVAMSADALRHALLSVLSYVLENCAGGSIDLGAAPATGSIQLCLVARLGNLGRPAGGRDGAGGGEDTRLTVGERLLELHGGSLELAWQPTLAVATTVLLRLPAVEQASVLIIDDSHDFVQLLQRYLRGHPYEVLPAHNAEQARQLACEGRPQIVILDVLMPSQDGWQILQHLRRLDQMREVPIVICSVLNDRTLAQSLGATRFLSKPVTQRALLAVLDECRAMRAASRARSANSG